jgi:hypothetical protein
MELTQEQVKKLQTARIHFCIPAYGGQISEATFISMLKYMATAQRFSLNFTIDTMVNESLVVRFLENSKFPNFKSFKLKLI